MITSNTIANAKSTPSFMLGNGKLTERMVRVAASDFTMGSSNQGEFEQPEHQVFIDDFFIDETLVTNEEYLKFVQQTGYISTAEIKGFGWGFRDGKYSDLPCLCWKSFATPERANHPVVMVSWHDAMAYAEWIGKRLPTEAEWEKAARGGIECKSYPWGDSQPNIENSGFTEKYTGEIPATMEVTLCERNGFGLYQMVGNVWQWCSDWYKGSYYQDSPRYYPKGPETGEFRVRRGGAWNVRQEFRLRCANRGALNPDATAPNMGFRCAADATLL